MFRSFLKGGVFYKTPQLHENASISKDSDIVNKWYVDTKVNNTQINTKQYVDNRVASIPIVDASSFVNISGNQNINGTKYFNSSPTVPNPTSGTHAANKAYVDSKIEGGGAWSTNDTSVKAALNASGAAPIYACRAWVNFNSIGTIFIRASGNVSSITDNRKGDYTVNFTTAMVDKNFSVNFGSSQLGDDTESNSSVGLYTTTGGGHDPYTFITTSSIRLQKRIGDTGALIDTNVITVSIFR